MGHNDGKEWTRTENWDILLNDKIFSNHDQLQSEEDCIKEIEEAKERGYEGEWSYREWIQVVKINKIINYKNQVK